MKIKSPGTLLHTNTKTPVKPSVITSDNTPPDTIEWCQCRCYERVMRCCDCHQKIDTAFHYNHYLSKHSDDQGYWWRFFCPVCYEKHKDDTDLDTLYRTHESCCLPDEFE